MPSGHAPNYYVLIPLLAVMAFLAPVAMTALATALGIVAALQQLH